MTDNKIGGLTSEGLVQRKIDIGCSGQKVRVKGVIDNWEREVTTLRETINFREE